MIDTARDSDIPALAEMLFALDAHHAAQMPASVYTDGKGPALERFLSERMAEGARALIYRTEGVARGYLLWQLPDPPETSLERPDRQALLDHICVSPIWRHRGLGRRLIARFEAEIAAEGCTGWISRVHACNAASAAMMRAQGAHLVAEVYEKRFQAPA